MSDFIEQIAHFSFRNFHFLRPEFLWLSILVAALLALLLLFGSQKKRWKKLISPHLQPFMFTKKGNSTWLVYTVFLLIALLSILALAGPSWQKNQLPGQKSESVLTIAIDLSQSMLVEDIQPNRLERARYKIIDLLDADPKTKIALFAYAGTPHLLMPECSDYALIRHHLKSFRPEIMPLQGSNIPLLLEAVDSSMSHREAPGVLMLITDVLSNEDALQIIDFAENNNRTVEIFTLATLQGGPIPKPKSGFYEENGNQVISKLNSEALYLLQKSKNVNVNTLTLDNSDVTALAEKLKKNRFFQNSDEDDEEAWKDFGYYILFAIALLFAFWFRKGWMINWAWIGVLFLFSSCNSVEKWDDLWYTPDYQAQKLYNTQDFESAASTFEDPIHQGIAFYKAGNFDAAAFAFGQDSSALSMYNQSLAFAKMGLYDKAQEAMNVAIEKDSTNSEYQQSMKQIEFALAVVDSLNSQSESPQEADQDNKPNKLNEYKAKGKDEELTSDTEAKELPKDGDRVTDEVDSGIRKAKELTEVPDEMQKSAMMEAKDVLLQGISDDPAFFLQRRFAKQYKLYYEQNPALKKEDRW